VVVPTVMMVVVPVKVQAIVPPARKVVIEIIRAPVPVIVVAWPRVGAVVARMAIAEVNARPTVTVVSIADPIHFGRPCVGMPECRTGDARGTGRRARYCEAQGYGKCKRECGNIAPHGGLHRRVCGAHRCYIDVCRSYPLSSRLGFGCALLVNTSDKADHT
jgi:hypothetical protein